MEQLTNRLDTLTLDKEPVVGVFYHKDMLLHKPVKHHPENPNRLTSILDHLEKEDLLSKCKIYNDFGDIERDILVDFHGEDYVEYAESLWDPDLKKDIRYYKDTYYNQHTLRAANLAANGVKLAVDEIYEGKIHRAYGIIRPPGHHAAAGDNRISGFCVYNNVAVAAKYAIKKYGVKKVMIFDWDVHHGDSTSKFLYNDASILYISTHRFDKGSFYPGEFGNMNNVGDGEGKGFNINYAWDLPHPYCTVGDQEYIYGLERVLLPIIKEFNPELVFISAGFDSARGDPLGGIDLTPDGYAYMTKRLMDLAPCRTIIALEGGYNLHSIAISSEACLRVLLGEEMPVKNSENERTLEAMKTKCSPNEIGLDTAQRAIEIFSSYWPILKQDSTLLEFEKICQEKSKATPVEIAAGHRDAIIIKQEKFLKRLKDKEIKFYTDLKDIHQESFEGIEFLEETKLISSNFTSKCLDMTLINSKSYAILENLCFMHPKASIVDFKLGRITYSPEHSDEVKKYHMEKCEKTISSKLGFRISGLILKDKKGEVVHRAYRDEIYYQINTSNISDYIERFLKSNDADQVNVEAAQYFTKFLKDLSEFFENTNTRAWIGTSIFLVLDNTKNYYRAAWIDLGKYTKLDEGERDQNILEGLHSLHSLFQNQTLHK